MSDVEGPIHRSVLAYLRQVLPSAFIVHHCANKPRSKQQGGKEKALGAIRGWPDLEVHGQDESGRPCLWLFEVKPPRVSVPAYQTALHDRLADIGWKVAVVRSIDDAERWLRTWGLLPAARETRLGREDAA